MYFIKHDPNCPECHGDGCYEINTYDGHRSDTTYVQCIRCMRLHTQEIMEQHQRKQETLQKKDVLRAEDI